MARSNDLIADRIGGIIWIALGAAIGYGSWAMDRLNQLQIHPATVRRASFRDCSAPA